MHTRNEVLDAILATGGVAAPPERLAKLLAYLRQIPHAALTLVVGDRDPLLVLDPAEDTLGFLFVLVARLRVEDRAGPAAFLLQRATAFARTMDCVQAWLAPEQMRALAVAMSMLADRAGQPAAPILALSAIITRHPEFSAAAARAQDAAGQQHSLTPIHAVLLKHCISARMYRRALPFISRDITVINKSAYGLTYQDFLLYHYYGGIVHAALKNFGRALEFFQLCVSAPAAPGFVSAIQIEAHRKSILVSLLATGAAPPPPLATKPAGGAGSAAAHQGALGGNNPMAK
ncbi:hypothetical protein HK405_015716, partial [Cladochytrium tenue]